MNPGNLPEEVGQTARSIVNSLQNQPAVLAVVILNIVFVGVVGYLTATSVARKDQMLLVKDEEVAALTNKCIDLAVKVVPPRGGDGGNIQH